MSVKSYRVCDKCGGFIEEGSNHATFIREKWKPYEPFDLCEECADSVQKFIHGKEENDGDRD